MHNLDGRIAIEWTNVSETNPGDFPVEGYTVFQGESVIGPWKRLSNYDVDNGTGIIFDQDFDLNDGVVLDKPQKFGSDNGIKHFFSTDQDAINGGTLSNVTNYFFRVEAYSYNPNETPKTLTSATVIRGTPQQPNAETVLPTQYFDTLASVHPTGISQGTVTPLVASWSVLF